MKGNIFSPEDKEFMEIVQSDLQKYLQRNLFPSRTVLVFPPFNGFRRFLIHKLVEDNFSSSDVAAFSIGQDINRRIVICYKGLISEAVRNGLPATVPQPSKKIMIDKEKPSRQRQTPAIAVYRPPAARLAESRKSTEELKTADTKKSRVRRPDQQVYVPRPKRASYGGNDLARSRSRSNSRLSLDSDQSLDLKKESSGSYKELKSFNENGTTNALKDDSIEAFKSEAIAMANKVDISSSLTSEQIQQSTQRNSTSDCSFDIVDECYSKNKTVLESPKYCKGEEITKCGSVEMKSTDESESREVTANVSKEIEVKDVNEGDMQTDSHVDEKSNDEVADIVSQGSIIENKPSQPDKSTKIVGEHIIIKHEVTSNEVMETISISSESKSDESSSSSWTSSSDSKTSESSVDLKDEEKLCKHKSSEEMDLDKHEEKKCSNKSKNRSQQREEKKRVKTKLSTPKVSEILVISDTSSSDDSMKSAEDGSEKKCNVHEKLKCQQSLKKAVDVKVVSQSSTEPSKVIDPDECDWESLYDDSGECLVPSLMEELTNSVGKVKVTSAGSDYRPYQSVEERTNDGECVIEIYDFPSEFKTTDLFNIFAAYRNKNFQIKWVDDTHALGIFPSPLMADEVLACTLPFVKTRPLRLGIAESRTKARNLILPPLPAMERPKTCTALARRLVTGALGLRIPTSNQDREREKQVLKEAREKRRLEAKQREAAWEGTITSGSAI